MPCPPYTPLADVQTGRHDTYPVGLRVWDMDEEAKRALTDYPAPEYGPLPSLGLYPGVFMQSEEVDVTGFCLLHLLAPVNVGLGACGTRLDEGTPRWSSANKQKHDLPASIDLALSAPDVYLLDGRAVKGFVAVKRP